MSATNPKSSYFYPRPPRGGRQRIVQQQKEYSAISIHALREEGDSPSRLPASPATDFYPRPPRGGRLSSTSCDSRTHCISIHALREEGDCCAGSLSSSDFYFYPRPPRGGRPKKVNNIPIGATIFLSTPSARRATIYEGYNIIDVIISIHALREEGDPAPPAPSCPRSYFYPRPPRGGRQPVRCRGA